MNLVASFLLLLSLASVTFATCSFSSFSCPTGEKFTANTCLDINDEIKKSSCPEYKCGGEDVQNWYNRNDGCSGPTPLGITTLSMTVFRSACGIHDMCYATPVRTQRQCDDDFHYNMRETCMLPGGNFIGQIICKIAARIAYTSVQNRGESFYNNAQTSFAQTCTKV